MTQPEKLSLAVNAALDQYRVARARMGLLNGGVALDTKRPQAWCEYGWPDIIEYQDLYALYRRGGVAHGAVEKIISTCWKTNPEVIEGDDQDESESETAWERDAAKALTARLWRGFAEADRRRLVGRYAGLILHVRDSEQWDQPVTRASSALQRVTPAWAGALMVAKYDEDPASPRYGLPVMWQYTEAGRSGGAGRIISVHHDRVFILGDWTADAIGFLEPAYNAFVSLEKIEGGSGESFLKNAARQINVNFDKGIDLQGVASMYGVPLADLQEKFNEAAREINRGNDAMLITQGAAVSPLVANVPDPRPSYDVNLQTIAAALDIPSKILVGMQTGERASTEDQRYFNARCQSRRMDLSFEIEDFVDHLIRIRVLDPVTEKAVIWDDLNEQTQAEKLSSAKTMADINAVALATGQPIFEPDEIRTAAGYDPAGVEPLGEDDEVEDGDDDAPADPTE